jgi:hypothetical protein
VHPVCAVLEWSRGVGLFDELRSREALQSEVRTTMIMMMMTMMRRRPPAQAGSQVLRNQTSTRTERHSCIVAIQLCDHNAQGDHYIH